ncbi:hypothetical protein R3P38DRAFT_2759988 [Favolaschia claudopus]|uniref:Uncharacterized protein n=1 Tax=Favolaschia claudopus TaxID=2862362 RepID=A0AAW0E4W4_9AGAR
MVGGGQDGGPNGGLRGAFGDGKVVVVKLKKLINLSAQTGEFGSSKINRASLQGNFRTSFFPSDYITNSANRRHYNANDPKASLHSPAWKEDHPYISGSKHNPPGYHCRLNINMRRHMAEIVTYYSKTASWNSESCREKASTEATKAPTEATSMIHGASGKCKRGKDMTQNIFAAALVDSSIFLKHQQLC